MPTRPPISTPTSGNNTSRSPRSTPLICVASTLKSESIGVSTIQSHGASRHTRIYNRVNSPPNTSAISHEEQSIPILNVPHTNDGSLIHSRHPIVIEIQNRVTDIVRKFNDDNDHERNITLVEDAIDSQLNVPIRWNVGDVLMATHLAMSKTTTRTDRAIACEFIEDPEINTIMHEGENQYKQLIETASKQGVVMKEVLQKTFKLVKQLQEFGLQSEFEHCNDATSSSRKLENMKTIIEALHNEKTVVLAQLNELEESQSKTLQILDEQKEELKGLHTMLDIKMEEVREAKDLILQTKLDGDHALATSQAQMNLWKDKHTNVSKTLVSLEEKVKMYDNERNIQKEMYTSLDNEHKVKLNEIERMKDRLRSSDLALAKSEEEVRAKKQQINKLEQDLARCSKMGEGSIDRSSYVSSVKSKASMEDKTKLINSPQTEAALAGEELERLQQQVLECIKRKTQLEAEIDELADLVREKRKCDLQEKLRNDKKDSIKTNVLPDFPQDKATSKRRMKRKCSKITTVRNDDLSTESDSDPENDSKETIKQSFSKEINDISPNADRDPIGVKPIEGKSNDCPIFEGDVHVSEEMRECERRLSTITSHESVVTVNNTNLSTTVAITQLQNTSTSQQPADPELQIMDHQECQEQYTRELNKMKAFYMATLQEYKTLIISQYEKQKQDVKRKHHEELDIATSKIKESFAVEILQRDRKLVAAKEALKILYRKMHAKKEYSTDRHDQINILSRAVPDNIEDSDEEAQPQSGNIDMDQFDQHSHNRTLPSNTVFGLKSESLHTELQTNESKPEIIVTDVQHRKISPKNTAPIYINDKTLITNVAHPKLQPSNTNGTKLDVILEQQISPLAPKVSSSSREREKRVGMLLRATVFMLSGSKTRSDIGSTQVNELLKDFALPEQGPTSEVVNNQVQDDTVSVKIGCSVGVQTSMNSLDHMKFCKGLKTNEYAPEDVSRFILPSIGCSLHTTAAPSQTTRFTERPFAIRQGQSFSSNLIEDLDRLFPMFSKSGTGPFYVSIGLKERLLTEIVKFYCAPSTFRQYSKEDGVRLPSTIKPTTNPLRLMHHGFVGHNVLSTNTRNDDNESDENDEIIIGSPRDTPFMRRKALEWIDKGKRQKRRSIQY